MKKKALMILLALPVLYFLTGAYVCYTIDHIAFVPNKMDRDEPYEFDFEFSEEFIKVNEEDSASLIYSKTSQKSKGLVLFFHGNSADLRSWGKMSPQFHKNGYDVVMIDYPGFGKSTGKHSEQALYDSADRLYTWAKQKYDDKDMVILGRSIGSVPASYLSSKRKVKRTILETPLANMGLLIENKFRYAPVCSKLYKRFTVDKWMKASKNETHVIRSENDKLILAKANESIVPMAASHFLVEGAEHGNLGIFDSYQKRLSELLLN